MTPILLENHFLITKQMHGLRADQFLKRKVSRLSRTKAQKIILAHDFLLDHNNIKPSQRVLAGQKATLKRFAPDYPNDIFTFKIEILFENEDILILNKPAKLTLHPTANHFYKTLTYWLKTNFPKKKINPCHRLDKDTSGLVVCAKNKRAERELKTAFMNQKVKKTYLAVVEGAMRGSKDINIPLILQKDRGLVTIRMIADQVHGKVARTKVKALNHLDEHKKTLVMCKPYTGRQHQIRTHLSLIGHPIVNDLIYGQDDKAFDEYYRSLKADLKPPENPRHKLHAYSLRFSLKGKKFFFKCRPPEDFYNESF